jgi:hypothetical protein
VTREITLTCANTRACCTVEGITERMKRAEMLLSDGSLLGELLVIPGVGAPQHQQLKWDATVSILTCLCRACLACNPIQMVSLVFMIPP